MIMYRDKFGKELETLEWGKLFENMEYRRVGDRKLWNGLWVSTVWLGLNHGFGKEELYFETMVFKKRLLRIYKWWGCGEEVDTVRYATLHQAEQGHEKVVHQYMPFYQKLFYRIFGGL